MVNKSWKQVKKYHKGKHEDATTSNKGKHDASHGRRARGRVRRFKNLEEKLNKRFPGKKKKELRDMVLNIIKASVFHLLVSMAHSQEAQDAVKAAHEARVKVCFNM